LSRFDAVEALLGVALITLGLALVSIPAACIAAGLCLLGFAVWPPRRKG
jgi:hypothetical protein